MTIRPEAAFSFAKDAIDAGWNALIQHGQDTSGNPFVSVEARNGHRALRLTWHTRDTGTYRLFSAQSGHRTITLRDARNELDLDETEETA